mmetsp:Transcript_450/g.1281  ORF Transcript_450/g.1281 Transcript_450/m.1281 type:complete len:243 (+) Transcript_450:1381-2109(+)
MLGRPAPARPVRCQVRHDGPVRRDYYWATDAGAFRYRARHRIGPELGNVELGASLHGPRELAGRLTRQCAPATVPPARGEAQPGGSRLDVASTLPAGSGREAAQLEGGGCDRPLVRGGGRGGHQCGQRQRAVFRPRRLQLRCVRRDVHHGGGCARRVQQHERVSCPDQDAVGRIPCAAHVGERAGCEPREQGQRVRARPRQEDPSLPGCVADQHERALGHGRDVQQPSAHARRVAPLGHLRR